MKYHILVVLILYLGFTTSLSRADSDLDDDSIIVSDDIDDTEPEDRSNDNAINYQSPEVSSRKFHFADHFDDKIAHKKKWILSRAKKDDTSEEISKYDGEFEIEHPQRVYLRNDLGLVLKSKAKHSAISAPLMKKFSFKEKLFIVQYEVLLQEGQDCGGAYLKLLSDKKGGIDLKQFNDKTPYTIMFGPDKCGNDIKLHFIFRHVNPINGTITEKHCVKPQERIDDSFKDKLPHLYQLMIRPDNTFTVKYDHNIINEGSLLNDFTPPVNPPREIDDPTDKKPENWDDREKIPDPTAEKPDDWNEDLPPQIPDASVSKPEGWLDDEDELIRDPNAVKPDDWDIEIDGEWEQPLITNPKCEQVGCGVWKAPLITNPDFKGKWRAPSIPNPNYRGKWAPRKIPNPDFYEDLNPYNRMTPIGAVGIELWSMSNEILFDNIIITDNETVALEWAAETFDLKRKQIDRQAGTFWERMMRRMNYKPGYWVLYFIYCAIPCSIYIWYLVRRANEESFVTRVVKFTNENPWLWAVYVIVIGLPLAFLIYCVCAPSKKSDVELARMKKTDEPVPDDGIEEEQKYERLHADGDDDHDDSHKNIEISQKSKKSDLDAEPNRKPEPDVIDNNEDDEPEDDDDNDDDEEEEEDEDEDEDDDKDKDGIGYEDLSDRKGFEEISEDIILVGNSAGNDTDDNNDETQDKHIGQDSPTTTTTTTAAAASTEGTRKRKTRKD